MSRDPSAYRIDVNLRRKRQTSEVDKAETNEPKRSWWTSDRLATAAAIAAAFAAIGSLLTGAFQYNATFQAVNAADRNRAIETYLINLSGACEKVEAKFDSFSTDGVVAINRDTIPAIPAKKWQGQESGEKYRAFMTSATVVSVWLGEAERLKFQNVVNYLKIILEPRQMNTDEIWAHQVAGKNYMCAFIVDRTAQFFRDGTAPKTVGPEILLLNTHDFHLHIRKHLEDKIKSGHIVLQ